MLHENLLENGAFVQERMPEGGAGATQSKGLPADRPRTDYVVLMGGHPQNEQITMLARLPRTLALGAVVLATIAGGVSTAERRGRLLDCTITGTAGDDTLGGTANRDIICALAGDFVLGVVATT